MGCADFATPRCGARGLIHHAVGVFASHAGAAALSNGTVALKVNSSGAVATNPLAQSPGRRRVRLLPTRRSAGARSRLPDSRAEPWPSRSSSVRIPAGSQRIFLISQPTASRRRFKPWPVGRRMGVCPSRDSRSMPCRTRSISGYRTEQCVTTLRISACSASSRTRTTSPSPICSPRRSRSCRQRPAMELHPPVRQVGRAPPVRRAPAQRPAGRRPRSRCPQRRWRIPEDPPCGRGCSARALCCCWSDPPSVTFAGQITKTDLDPDTTWPA